MKKVNFKLLAASFVVVIIVAAIGSLFTTSAVKSEWYQSIKPALTPPNWVFPVVWNILFFLIALSLYFALTSTSKNKEMRSKVVLAYGINFILNILWSALYFGLKNPLAALFCLILLLASIIYIITLTSRFDKRSSYLMIPYLSWICFAGVLNYLSI